mmetsp:Transcript_28014/g.39385  ORF Transcript_28014/g.39385 Transcript_28014/m.39385 type:complete len:83 (+) Transcript_28014:160-408(+)
MMIPQSQDPALQSPCVSTFEKQKQKNNNIRPAICGDFDTMYYKCKNSIDSTGSYEGKTNCTYELKHLIFCAKQSLQRRNTQG